MGRIGRDVEECTNRRIRRLQVGLCEDSGVLPFDEILELVGSDGHCRLDLRQNVSDSAGRSVFRADREKRLKMTRLELVRSGSIYCWNGNAGLNTIRCGNTFSLNGETRDVLSGRQCAVALPPGLNLSGCVRIENERRVVG